MAAAAEAETETRTAPAGIRPATGGAETVGRAMDAAAGDTEAGPAEALSAAETASVVDDALYERLAGMAAARAEDPGPGRPELRAAAEQALFHEARLLDDRRYRDWLDRFTPDCVYWVPLDLGGDPRRQVSYLLDDRRRMADRIGLLETGWAHAQNPPSRTVRTVSNVEAWPADSGDGYSNGDIRARCSVVVWEYRRGRLTPFASRNDYVLAAVGDDWAIRIKIVGLVNCDGDVPKFAFVL